MKCRSALAPTKCVNNAPLSHATSLCPASSCSVMVEVAYKAVSPQIERTFQGERRTLLHKCLQLARQVGNLIAVLRIAEEVLVRERSVVWVKGDL